MHKPIELRRSQSDSQINPIKRWLFVVSVLLSLSFHAGCSDTSWDGPAPHDNLASSDNLGLPTYISVSPENTGDGWSASTPDTEGMDAQVLLTGLENIRDGSYPGVDSVVVVKNGKLVAEAYYNGYGRDAIHDLRSASKSITSALAGIAIEQGVLSTEDQLVNLVDNLGGYKNPDQRKAAIKVINLLNMNSGLECDDWDASSIGNETNMYLTRDWVKFVLDLPMVSDPGSQTRYCTGGVILLGSIISARTGMNLDDYASTYLFGPMGIRDVKWRRSPDGQATGGGGLRLRPRDAAKFGQLYLDQGVWGNGRVISSQWIEKSKQSVTTLSQIGYGLLWWKRDFQVRNSTQNAFFAAGNGGNDIFVFPLEQLVVVFTGSNFNSPQGDQPFAILSQHILPALR